MSEDTVEQWRSDRNSKLSTFLSKMHVGHILLLGALCLIFVYTNADGSATDSKSFNYVIFGTLVVVILFLIFKPEKSKKVIPEYIAKRIAQQALAKKREEGIEIPHNSQVDVMAACHLVYENDMASGTSGPVAWHVGFREHVNGTAYTKEGVIMIHPFDGHVTGIDWRPLGYSGVESRDKDIIPVGIVQGNAKTTDFGTPGKMS